MTDEKLQELKARISRAEELRARAEKIEKAIRDIEAAPSNGASCVMNMTVWLGSNCISISELFTNGAEGAFIVMRHDLLDKLRIVLQVCKDLYEKL